MKKKVVDPEKERHRRRLNILAAAERSVSPYLLGERFLVYVFSTFCVSQEGFPADVNTHYQIVSLNNSCDLFILFGC